MRQLIKLDRSSQFFRKVLETTAHSLGKEGLEPSFGDSVNCPVFSKTRHSLCFAFLNSELLGFQGAGEPPPQTGGSLYYGFLHPCCHLPFLHKFAENSSPLMAHSLCVEFIPILFFYQFSRFSGGRGIKYLWPVSHFELSDVLLILCSFLSQRTTF